MGIAQLVEHLIEKPGAVANTDAGSTSGPQSSKGFFSQSQLPVHSLSLSLSFYSHSVHAAPVLCAIGCINISVHVISPKHWQPYHCPDTQILHTLIEMGSTTTALFFFFFLLLKIVTIVTIANQPKTPVNFTTVSGAL